ncbi:MAG: DUF294 nucleotidyltransferase-like domain-containing protein, partial [Parachlamydia sp.]|nr:DUF294 nucleotidyltransferase-like domain-containing protein [Parachlamydia sp.]
MQPMPTLENPRLPLTLFSPISPNLSSLQDAPVTSPQFPQSTPNMPPPMTWPHRGEYHLQRQELGLAVEAFTNALQGAEKQRHPDTIGGCLKDIARVLLEKGEWRKAAQIFNAAFVVLQKTDNEKLRRVVLALMGEVERRFLEKVCSVRFIPDPQVYLVRRKKLQSLRQNLQAQLEQNASSEKMLLEFTLSISSFLEEVLKNGFTIFGKPPCAYALMGLGSLARKEMSPFSDLEFALLVERDSPQELEYFRNLVQWLEL